MMSVFNYFTFSTHIATHRVRKVYIGFSVLKKNGGVGVFLIAVDFQFCLLSLLSILQLHITAPCWRWKV